MESYEIYWDDLTAKAQERLKALWHENVGISPLAIVDIESEEENDQTYTDTAVGH